MSHETQFIQNLAPMPLALIDKNNVENTQPQWHGDIIITGTLYRTSSLRTTIFWLTISILTK